MSQEPHDLTGLESALVALAPTPSRLDRDGLMFAAGRASVSRTWIKAACGLAGLSVALALVLIWRPTRVVERTVVVRDTGPPAASTAPRAPVSTASEPTELISSDDPKSGPYRNPFLEMRRQLLNRGDLAEPGHPAGVFAAPPRQPLEKDLDLPPGSLRGVVPGRRSSSLGPW